MVKSGGKTANHVWLPAILAIFTTCISGSHSFRSWECIDGKCIKGSTNDPSASVSIDQCKITCLDFAGLWPRPTVNANISKNVVQFDPTSIMFYKYELPATTSSLVEAAQQVFLDRIRRKSVIGFPVRSEHGISHRLEVWLEIYDPSVIHFQTYTDESYWINLKRNTDFMRIEVEISANTFFGLRHGLETLAQLIIFDDIHQVYKIVDGAVIEDRPLYTHRGITVDTARSYIGVETLLKMLDAMAMNKLNTFHWHIVDTHSFPYVSNAYPQLSLDGAYSDREVYTQKDIKNIVEYARLRGIRIIPEFDAPAHVGEGWSAIDPSLITCFKWEPWKTYCAEPPCGQFDPTNEFLYSILDIIYKEFLDLFPSDLIHMGGDEVNFKCWESTDRIVQWMKNHNYTIDDDGFNQLWLRFQDKVYKNIMNAKHYPTPKPILWTSSLTNIRDLQNYLSPEDYIIQIWTKKTDDTIRNLLINNYKLILSNYDELYLDCGGPSWLGEPSQNWCSPYHNWQVVYDHSPTYIANIQGISDENVRRNILGSEAAIWTEQIDDSSLLVRTWPRASALAERLWADPVDNWQNVQYRLLYQRNRMVRGGIESEVLQPEWCQQNDGSCK